MSEKQIKISYKPLWRMLLERDMTKVDLRKKTKIAPSTFTKMSNNEQVSLDILARICLELECGFDDVVEIMKERKELEE
ncbi:MAG: helix-turn-helix transcriptional regulator [Anaerostipes sp.]|nr:helix-turn-helix transcriptional regulator [Anaerostipes sp.]